MKLLVYVLCVVVLVFVWHRSLRKSLTKEGGAFSGSRLRLASTLLAMLGGGFALLVFLLRGLIRGEISCSSKGGGCPSRTVLVATDPHAYWFEMSHLTLITGMLLWGGYLILRNLRNQLD
ncbi:hypothetical protein [Variovorax sp. PAMC26660]|uniref:hypothetical protein n=1 Tax=Variovorax sp. PAMC26660 TaxID=2762322 RepID=UPI00164DE24C|nr:hypothetical protein [Variovorax sp. PAMC26660]QNK65664.1 hypothetical protein H7F35_20885 [Variovorax sp. PAMC26660]